MTKWSEMYINISIILYSFRSVSYTRMKPYKKISSTTLLSTDGHDMSRMLGYDHYGATHDPSTISHTGKIYAAC